MRTVIFMIFCLMAGFSANAQDLLVTTKGDTLNCKITKEDTEYVYFSFKKDGEVRNTLVGKRQVQVIQKDYFDQPEISSEEIKKISPKTHHPLKIGISGGWGYRTSKIIAQNAEQANYLKGLRAGFQVGLDVDYYFNNYAGAGLKYSLFHASASGRVLGSDMKDNTSIHFIGPTFSTRFMNASKKNAFIMNLSLGYLGYFDSGKVEGLPVKITASTLGTALDLGYEVGLSSHVALLFQVSSVLGSFSEMNVSSNGYSEKMTLPDDQKESLNRIDLSVGIRVH